MMGILHKAPRKKASAPAPSKTGAQSEHDLAALQQAAGNLAAQRLLRSGAIQARPEVSPPVHEHQQKAGETVDQSTGPQGTPRSIVPQAR